MATTLPPPPQPKPSKSDGGFNDPIWHRWFGYVKELFDSIMSKAEFLSRKDQPDGYAGLGALYEIHFVDQTGANLSLLTNLNLGPQVYTFPDRTDTVVLQNDVVTLNALTTTNDATVGGILSSAGAVGFNGATPQTPVTLPADATDLATVITLANALKASAISFGFNT